MRSRGWDVLEDADADNDPLHFLDVIDYQFDIGRLTAYVDSDLVASVTWDEGKELWRRQFKTLAAAKRASEAKAIAIAAAVLESRAEVLESNAKRLRTKLAKLKRRKP